MNAMLARELITELIELHEKLNHREGAMMQALMNRTDTNAEIKSFKKVNF